jgi:hypothetical protein
VIGVGLRGLEEHQEYSGLCLSVDDAGKTVYLGKEMLCTGRCSAVS